VGATTVNMTALKATLGMKMGDFSTGLAISKLDNNVNRKTNNWMLTGTYKMGSTTFKANYGASSESADGADDALTMLGLEAGYAFNSAATVYSYYTTINNNTNAKGAFAVSDDNLTPLAGKSPKAFGLGMRYNF
jgi:cell division protein FtsI/penicillin-binding protein 2